MSEKLTELNEHLEESDWETEITFEKDVGTISIYYVGIIVEVEGERIWFHPNKDAHPGGLARLVRDLERSDFHYVLGEMFGFEGETLKFASDYEDEEEFERRTEPFVRTEQNLMFG